MAEAVDMDRISEAAPYMTNPMEYGLLSFSCATGNGVTHRLRPE